MTVPKVKPGSFKAVSANVTNSQDMYLYAMISDKTTRF